MASCPFCRNPAWMAGVPCSKCGRTSQSGPDLELEVPAAPPPKATRAATKKKDVELKIDFAIDPDDLRPPVAPAPSVRPGGSFPPASPPSPSSSPPGRTVAMVRAPPAPLAAIPTPIENDEHLAARTLANFGEPPKSIVLAPLYAYKVYKRRKELAEALAGRREESAIAARKLEDALVTLGERARATAAGDEEARATLDALARAEALLRSRDQSLARENDQHRERIASIDQRLSGVETELAQAQGAERAVSAELADLSTQLQRAEARLKQAESELKAITSRDRGARA